MAKLSILIKKYIYLFQYERKSYSLKNKKSAIFSKSEDFNNTNNVEKSKLIKYKSQ